nr:type IIL restriction-modification enzyme MmeI [Micrococcus sp. JXJ CY 30]
MPRALHNANFIAPDEDGFAFAVISTSAFIAWQRRVGGALESWLRFSNPLVMDPALVKAHAALGRIMDSLLGLSAGATEKERQTRLMELYAARV